MELTILVFFILISPLIIYFIIKTKNSIPWGKIQIEKWATKNNYKIINLSFTTNTTNILEFMVFNILAPRMFKIKIQDDQGKLRTGTITFGKATLISWDDTIDVKWDE